jgi:hypothetical protein
MVAKHIDTLDFWDSLSACLEFAAFSAYRSVGGVMTNPPRAGGMKDQGPEDYDFQY